MVGTNKFGSWLLVAVSGLALAVVGAAKSPEKVAATAVDSGSFGVFVNGQRVATETFSIQQRADVSTASSEVKATDGKNEQRSEMQLTAAGNLRRYEWKEISPGKSQAVVEPMDDFLVEHITTEPGAKPQDKPFILPTSTLVLDDYAFSHREILVWRYLAQACASGLANCRPAKAQFGVLIPHQQMSAPVTVEYVGPEGVTMKGEQRILNRFNISSEDSVWSVWMDPTNMKVTRMSTGNTEVVRD
jgi:hypothetical protein